MGRPNRPRYLATRDTWVTKIGGVQHTLARGKKNRREAERAMHRLLEARDSGKVLSGPKDLSIRALFDIFLDRCQRDTAGLTYEFYRRHLAKFMAHAGPGRLASSITHQDVHRWLDAGWDKKMPRDDQHPGGWRERRPYGQSTRHGAITAVKAAFSWAAEEGHISADPLETLEGPGMLRREGVLDAAAIGRILEAVDGWLRDFLEFMWETGCRPSEAMNLESSHVLLDQRIVKMKGKTTRRTKKPRVIYLTARATEILGRRIALEPSGHVFRSGRGNQVTRHTLAQRFARLREDLGMGGEGTAEAIRHAFGTDGAFRVPPLVLAELMGHAGPATSVKYYVHMDERRAEMLAALGDVRPDPDR